MKRHISQIASWLGLPSPTFPAEVEHLMIDSRSVVYPEATLFAALRTPNADGHAFIPELIARGVRNFIVDEIPPTVVVAEGVNFLVVADTTAALQTIGARCRDELRGTVVGITGSRGKTLEKERIAYALTRAGVSVSRSPRSWNSQIGVPLSLWQADPEAKYVLIEAGVSRKGEMAALERIIRPDMGLLTEITSEHDDGFASREEKVAEKKSLFKHITDSKHIINGRAEEFLAAIGLDPALAEGFPEIVTRLDVVDGVNNCRLILDRFTADIPSMVGALDLLKRRASGQKSVLIIAADIIRPEDEERFLSLVNAYGIDRVIRIAADDESLASRLTTDDFYNEIVLIKGSPSTPLDALYAMLEDKQHETLMEVSLDAIVSNFNFFRSKVRPTTGVICMLKAHGYGAGSVELARTLQSQGAAYIAVAVVDEGIELRRAGITMPIMVLNPRAQNRKMMFDYRLEPEIYSFDMLDDIIRSARRYGVTHFPIHIKLETGMRRLGFVEEDMERLGEILASTDSVEASTIFSHLACADDPSEDDYTRRQFEIFTRCCDRLSALLPRAPKRHILNSTGIIRFPEMQHDFVRLGIGLYGVPTLFDGSEEGLRNVSRLMSPIISIKHWKKGDTVGYNRRGRLDRDSAIATVPVGYADGIDRHLGYGNLRVMVNGHLCPTVGSICMDICMIDVTDLPAEPHVGDRVEFFGDNVTPCAVADILGTIPYEILTSVSPRVKRVYYRD